MSISIIEFEPEVLTFRPLMAACLIGDERFDLRTLHKVVEPQNKMSLFDKAYTLFRSKPFLTAYQELCEKLISQRADGGHVRYQKVPSVRICFPGEKSVNFHADSFYGHGPEISNFWLPLTEVDGSNSLWFVDDEKGRLLVREASKNRWPVTEFNRRCLQEAQPIKMTYGQVASFNSSTIHGTVLNETQATRVSFDFRMAGDGVSTGLKGPDFFVAPNDENERMQTQQRCVLYFALEGFKGKVPSQKYQQIAMWSYAKDNHMTSVSEETELCGFDYYPTLFSLLDRHRELKFDVIIVYSLDMLPTVGTPLRREFEERCSAMGVSVSSLV